MNNSKKKNLIELKSDHFQKIICKKRLHTHTKNNKINKKKTHTQSDLIAYIIDFNFIAFRFFR